ncbi:hypothetical protein B0A79_01335 [Flavobacterium piscis]|uniref:WYL domain-containing protein n=1 Tax=Flavobacterium piscis TaxID=1114874 RepID=A0ABX2XIZ6_9FLAO|nr:hypothetical protein [Flavobacterium piscis]OCB70134.1 hypothetical protein FLP_20980 [Flavobacterium piscis]OXG07870.1 hypothetical protein B0A79_01335 [Flavobacterium piscis]
MNNQIIEAIENQNIIEFSYEGKSRVVEPHCYGKTTAGNEAIRAYQIDGFSSSGKMGWKIYDLRKADDIEVTNDTFSTRNDYKRGDQGMSEIYAEI